MAKSWTAWVWVKKDGEIAWDTIRPSSSWSQSNAHLNHGARSNVKVTKVRIVEVEEGSA